MESNYKQFFSLPFSHHPLHTHTHPMLPQNNVCEMYSLYLIVGLNQFHRSHMTIVLATDLDVEGITHEEEARDLGLF